MQSMFDDRLHRPILDHSCLRAFLERAHGQSSFLEGASTDKEMVVAKKKPSALEALARLNDERRALDDRGAELKRAASLEIGMVVLDAGGAALGPTRLRALITQVVAIGIEAALQRLSSDWPTPSRGSERKNRDATEARDG